MERSITLERGALSLFIGCFLPDIYHVFNSGHAINWDNARVIDTCHHYHTRIFQILESWYISGKKHPMNKDRGPLSSVYRSLHMQLD